MASLIRRRFQRKWKLTGWTLQRNIPWAPTAGWVLLGYFQGGIFLISKKDLRLSKVQSVCQEIVGFLWTNVLDFHGTPSCVWRVWIQGAVEGTLIRSLGVTLEPSISLLPPPGDKTLSSQQPTNPLFLPMWTRSWSECTIAHSGKWLRRVDGAPFTQMPKDSQACFRATGTQQNLDFRSCLDKSCQLEAREHRRAPDAIKGKFGMALKEAWAWRPFTSGLFPGLVFVTLCSFPSRRPPNDQVLGPTNMDLPVQLVLGLRVRGRGIEIFQNSHSFKILSHSLLPLLLKPFNHYSKKSRKLTMTTRSTQCGHITKLLFSPAFSWLTRPQPPWSPPGCSMNDPDMLFGSCSPLDLTCLR